MKINDSDLCILLFNVLDNALEAAVQVPPPKNREIVFSIRLTQGFLAIDCENTYIGEPRTDGHGNFYSTKDDSSKHGFGLSQIRRTVDKYHGILDISYTDDLFKVQAALKIKTENGNKTV